LDGLADGLTDGLAEGDPVFVGLVVDGFGEPDDSPPPGVDGDEDGDEDGDRDAEGDPPCPGFDVDGDADGGPPCPGYPPDPSPPDPSWPPDPSPVPSPPTPMLTETPTPTPAVDRPPDVDGAPSASPACRVSAKPIGKATTTATFRPLSDRIAEPNDRKGGCARSDRSVRGTSTRSPLR
jgi:hypothetical protein